VFADPDGRTPGQEFHSEVDATVDALEEAVYHTEYGTTFQHVNGFAYGYEFFGWVCSKKCEHGCFVATSPAQGDVPSLDEQNAGATGASFLGSFEDAKRACGSDKTPVRTYHSHPSTPGGTADYGEPSPGDLNEAARRGLGGATMSKAYNAWFYNSSGAIEFTKSVP
jgi:hypothetical protein